LDHLYLKQKNIHPAQAGMKGGNLTGDNSAYNNPEKDKKIFIMAEIG
jgi:hypothetical protein